jgi:hypothetical protein
VYLYDGANWQYVRSKNEADKLKMVFTPASGSGGYRIFEYHKTFVDIQKHWAKQEIEWIASKRVVIGNQEKYSPNAMITKVQFATMLARALGLKEYQGDDRSYTDVSPKYWGFGAVEAVTRAGYMDVPNSKVFNPNSTITREDMVVALIRAWEDEKGRTELSTGEIGNILKLYVDLDEINHSAKESLALAIKLGIIKGVGNKLQPKQTATRAQAAVMIRRFMSELGLL